MRKDEPTIRSVNVHIQLQFMTNSLDVLQSLLIVRASTTDPDGDLVFDEDRSKLPKSADDTLECRRNVREVGNTTTNEEDLALRMRRRTEHEVQDGLGVEVGLVLTWSTRVLSVIGELTGEASGSNSISVDDRRTTSSNQSPNTSSRVQNGELEGSTSLSIKIGDVTVKLLD